MSMLDDSKRRRIRMLAAAQRLGIDPATATNAAEFTRRMVAMALNEKDKGKLNAKDLSEIFTAAAMMFDALATEEDKLKESKDASSNQ